MWRRKLAGLMAVAMMLQGGFTVQGAEAVTYTDEEIEKRINEVGEAYIDFYRNGMAVIEEDMDFAGAFNTLTTGSARGKSTAPTAVYEEAEAATDDGAYEAVEAEAGLSYTADIGDVFSDFPEADFQRENYHAIDESGFVSVKTQPFSTFGADVDTASYSSLRRKLLEPYAYDANPYFAGIDDSAIRVEEMMNYFTYNYKEPEGDEKFGVTTTLNPCPWNEDSLLLKVGIRAESIAEEDAGSQIVFLIDTSGSMFDFDKLPLVKTSLGYLVDRLDAKDRISIVTYAGSEEVVLEGAPGDQHDEIMAAIARLEAWGSTWGEGGIQKAYEIAEKYYVKGGNNRVILCTDGDFNVGVSSEAGLKDLISEKRQSGVFFSCLGFGGGNYMDTTMETLADNGNGNYFYIDSEREAERALSTEFFSTVYTVAKDTKFQVEFNPDTVKGYRLIGYENRKMAAEDFADDTKDGGEVGSGQTVTVLYEVIPADSDFEIPEVSSRYAKEKEDAAEEETDLTGELLAVNIRAKDPDEDESRLWVYPVSMEDLAEEMDADTSWAAGVAQAGMVMRDSAYAGTTTLEGIFDRLKNDPEIMENDFKAEFLFLLRAMKTYKESK